jgi:hypothetical protein
MIKRTLLFGSLTLFLLSFSAGRTDSIAQDSINLKAQEALSFAQLKGYNQEFCILIDMSIHSGLNRIFVWDFEHNILLDSGLCAHGCGESTWGTDGTRTAPIFSNTPESHLSSIGKYKIGKRGYSNWGINVNYKLHGLEQSNDNAYERFIVLHSWDMVSETETHPTGTPEGWGCPAVSNRFMTRLDNRLKDVSQPVLLWIYK